MGLVPRYVTVLVFSRDLGILLISTLLYATGTLRDFRPSLLGKLNTLAQIVGLTAVLVGQIAPSAGCGPLPGWTAAGDCGPGAALGGTVCVDRLPQGEWAGAGGGLRGGLIHLQQQIASPSTSSGSG